MGGTVRIAYTDHGSGDALVNSLNPFPVSVVPGAGIGDAFGRLRVSPPHTLFDGKQIHDNLPLFWDDAEVSGGGTGSSFSANRASTTLSVGDTTAGRRLRQTYMRFNYEPGKSLLVMLTGVISQSGGGTGITGGMGYGDDNNGFFFYYDEGTFKLIRRSSVTGTPVDTEVSQGSFNGDNLDGTGSSRFTLDPTKAQIGWIDMEWLGVGSVRMGFVIDGNFVTCHTFHHANASVSVYMSTPNLPLRYWIENDGTGTASTLEHICTTVISEGGSDNSGVLLSASTTDGASLAASTANTLYASLGIRLKSAYAGANVRPLKVSMVNTSSQDFEWKLLFNPTVAGTFTYADVTNAAVEWAYGATANTVTGGSLIASGFVKSGNSTGNIESLITSTRRLGIAIDGTRDTIVLCCLPFANNAVIHSAMTWREIL